jgi:hypothetical protein
MRTSREVFDDPVDRDRYCQQEYAALDGLGDAAPPQRVTDWRRYCWWLASIDGFPESYVTGTGEIVAERSTVGSPRDAWTSFCQRASIHDLADAMRNRREFSQNWRDPKSRGAAA